MSVVIYGYDWDECYDVGTLQSGWDGYIVIMTDEMDGCLGSLCAGWSWADGLDFWKISCHVLFHETQSLSQEYSPQQQHRQEKEKNCHSSSVSVSAYHVHKQIIKLVQAKHFTLPSITGTRRKPRPHLNSHASQTLNSLKPASSMVTNIASRHAPLPLVRLLFPNTIRSSYGATPAAACAFVLLLLRPAAAAFSHDRHGVECVGPRRFELEASDAEIPPAVLVYTMRL